LHCSGHNITEIAKFQQKGEFTVETNREKVSYCIGLEAGKNIRNQFKDIDLDLLKKGFNDAIGDKTPALAHEEMQRILKALQEQIQQQQKAFVLQVAEKNQREGEAFLEENKTKQGVISLPSGLQYKILASGTGRSPTIYDTVDIHYRGQTIDGSVFDSSYETGQPARFPVGRLIPGWSEALKMMKVGDKWQVFIPSYLAYGETGYGPQIEPNMVLIFEMELLGIV
jgi:FKBP-type peptidyl-prolyl cis-trans isomerase FklB